MLQFFGHIKPSTFFVIAAVLFEVLYTIVRPPFQSPDEFNHFYRAYQLSQGQLSAELKDQRLGGQIPISILDFQQIFNAVTIAEGPKLKRADVLRGFDIKLNSGNTGFVDFPNTAYYSIVSYLPQAGALAVLGWLDCSVGTLYYGGKSFAFGMWVLCIFWVIKILPAFKWLTVALVLLPMCVYMSNSLSADTMSNILSFLLIGMILRAAYSERKFETSDMLLILCVGILLAFAKVVYVGLLGLLFLIPIQKFHSKNHRIYSIGIILLVSFTVAFLWSQKLSSQHISYNEYNPIVRDYVTLHHKADYDRQKEILSANPLLSPRIVFNSLVTEPHFYLTSYIGHFGTYMDSPMPLFYVAGCFLILLLISLTENNFVGLKNWDRLVLFFTALLTYSILLLSLHLTWNDVGALSMDRVQGRYLIPIFPLIFYALNLRNTKLKFNPAVLVITFSVVSNLYVCYFLFHRYF